MCLWISWARISPEFRDLEWPCSIAMHDGFTLGHGLAPDGHALPHGPALPHGSSYLIWMAEARALRQRWLRREADAFRAERREVLRQKRRRREGVGENGVHDAVCKKPPPVFPGITAVCQKTRPVFSGIRGCFVDALAGQAYLASQQQTAGLQQGGIPAQEAGLQQAAGRWARVPLRLYLEAERQEARRLKRRAFSGFRGCYLRHHWLTFLVPPGSGGASRSSPSPSNHLG